jgi:hypothetical protein
MIARRTLLAFVTLGAAAAAIALAVAPSTIVPLRPSSPDVPFREPQLASSPDLVALAFGAGDSVYVATSPSDGQHFSKPVKVAAARVLPLSRHRGPRIVITRGTIVVTAVAGKTEATDPHAHGLPSDGDLFAWRSADGGKAWSPGVRINDVPAAPREGLHTLAADGRGNLFAAWLDLRKEGTRLYGAFSTDAGATWSSNALIYESPDGTICQCCHPSASYAEDGTLEVMWRNCLHGSRDLYLIRANNTRRFGTPEKLGTGTWKINACPMDGGGLAHAGRRTITAWRRGQEIFMAEPGQPETPLGEGKDVALATSQDRIYAVWVQGTQLTSWVSGKREVLAGKAAFPSLTALPGGGVLAAWEENGAISLRRLP